MTIPESTATPAVEQEKIIETPAVQSTETIEDPNWRAVREQRKKDKIAREEAEKRATDAQAQADALKVAMEAAFSKMPTQQYQSHQDDYREETEDERIDKKVHAALLAREAQAEKSRIEREKTELPMRLRKAYPDYDKIINEETGAYLEYHHPEILRTILRAKEDFESCSDSYQLVKKLIPGLQEAKKDEVRTQANLLKPKSSSSPSITESGQVTHPFKISEERKAANWERMQKELRSIG